MFPPGEPFLSHWDELSSLASCLCWLAERTRIRDELGGGSGLDGEDQANGQTCSWRSPHKSFPFSSWASSSAGGWLAVEEDYGPLKFSFSASCEARCRCLCYLSARVIPCYLQIINIFLFKALIVPIQFAGSFFVVLSQDDTQTDQSAASVDNRYGGDYKIWTIFASGSTKATRSSSLGFIESWFII